MKRTFTSSTRLWIVSIAPACGSSEVSEADASELEALELAAATAYSSRRAVLLAYAAVCAQPGIALANPASMPKISAKKRHLVSVYFIPKESKIFILPGQNRASN